MVIMQVLSPQPSHITYAISIEQWPNSNWLAQVLGWQDCRVETYMNSNHKP
jgi:hypothetical protein